ncbi:MAG: hypothetical protein ABI488_05020, partial [Polyangiaceae bacterium]
MSLVALGMGAFSSCSAGEFARPGREGGGAAPPVATLNIPAPPAAVVLAAVVPQAVAAVPVAPAPEPEATPEPEAPAEPEPDSDDDTPDEQDAPTSLREEGPIVEPDRLLVAIARETFIYERPSFKSTKLGYLRAGAQVRREAEPAGREGCKAGFYRIMPEGYVCVGPSATLDPNHPVAQFARVRPDRSAAMPYRYARSLYPTPPFYTR